NSLNAVSTSRWKLDLPDVVQIDVDPAMLGRYYGDRTTGVIGDAKTTLEDLTAALDGHAEQLASTRISWVKDLQGAEAQWWAGSDDAHRAAPGPPPPPDIIRRLRERSPDAALLIPDPGNPGVCSFLWEVREAGTYI